MTETVVLPPSEFVQFWNEILVPKFVKYKHVLVGGLSLHSAAIFPRLEVNEGEKVMDAGAGFGDTAIMLAKRVGPTGHVDAIDCCDAFLDDGRKDAAAEGVDNVSFVVADIQFTPFAPEYDLVFSRFGTMFFENPVAAMKNMRRALKPGGRFTMIVWRDMADNPWLGAAKAIALKHLRGNSEGLGHGAVLLGAEIAIVEPGHEGSDELALALGERRRPAHQRLVIMREGHAGRRLQTQNLLEIGVREGFEIGHVEKFPGIAAAITRPGRRRFSDYADRRWFRLAANS